MSRARYWTIIAAVLVVVTGVYLDHFDNSFHFDDEHTIVENPYIRSLAFLPKYFADAETFSIVPLQCSYRPIVTTTLALDYAIGGGLDPFYFHLSTFVWFMALLIALAYFSRRLFSTALASRWADRASIFSTAWFGLHPVTAETVNYIVQRADLYAALGALGGIALWAGFPRQRSAGFYLVPPTLACLAKQSAVMWAPLLCAYIFLIEEQASLELIRRRSSREALVRTLRKALPALLQAATMAVLVTGFAGEHYVPGRLPRAPYIWSQPWVTVHYLRLFLLPTELSADTDWQAQDSPWTTPALVGYAVIFVLLAVVYRASRTREWRPCAFGVAWFLIALLPTALVRLGELLNDHRLFFPAIGLVLAAAAALGQLARRGEGLSRHAHPWTAALFPLAAALLPLYAAGTIQRNEVWHDERSLWLDVTRKSPRNGRGLMNYGSVLLESGDVQGAYRYFREAQRYVPFYWNNATNLGLALERMGRASEAEAELRRAKNLAPHRLEPRYYLARWLRGRSRPGEAIAELEVALGSGVRNLAARLLLLDLYVQERRDGPARRLARGILREFPGQPEAARALEVASGSLGTGDRKPSADGR